MTAAATASYALLDSGDGQKLERFGDFTLVRPCAQAVWPKRREESWQPIDACFQRQSSGTGSWQQHTDIPDTWTMTFADLTWTLAPNEHGNVGIFPEQASCWGWIADQVRAAERPIEVLNLFAYSGGSTLAAAAAGASVCHVDASKTIMRQARQNAADNGMEELPVRWITDDAVRFVERELRRGRRYQGIILDPPSYGRGPKGEVWKIDESIQQLVASCQQLLADDAAFLLLTGHSPGYTPVVLANLIEAGAGATVESGEMVIVDEGGRSLPSGAYARWGRKP